MRLTKGRWVLVTLLGGLLAAALALPDWGALLDRQITFEVDGYYYYRDPVQRTMSRAIRTESVRNLRLRAEAARAFARRSLAERPAARDTSLVTWVTAAALPATDPRLRAVTDTVRWLEDSIARLRSRAARGAGAPVRVALVAMPDAMASGDGPLGAQSNQGSVGAWYVLPDSLGGATCAVVVKQGQLLMHGSVLANPLGPCFWYAAFGDPGRTMTRFLEEQGFAGMARAGVLTRGDASSGGEFALPQLFAELGMMGQLNWMGSLPSLVCNAHGGPSCTESAVGRYQRGGRDALRMSATIPWSYGLQFPRAMSVPNLVADLGPERFARLWRSDRPFADAFAEASGEPLDRYIQRAYQRESNASYHAGPWPLLGSLAALLIVAGLCLASLFASDRRPSVA